MTAPKVATERLYWNADKTKLLKEGEEGAVSLAAAVGDPVPEVESKSAAKAENKMEAAPENKSGSGVTVTKAK